MSEPDLPQTLVHLAQTFLVLGEEIAAGAGLTPQQWAVLHQVGAAGGEGVLPSAIAEASGTSRANVTKLVRGLTRLALVRVGSDPADGRQRRLRLTPSGARVLRRLDGEKARRITAALEGLAASERATLHRLGSRLLSRLGRRLLA
ncbi:MAG: MarR family transcriptional regulator [Deltaproteobacteria bacterium]|nr:MarR family transcriptional regulator [Deltaproteobacteria bacterium]